MPDLDDVRSRLGLARDDPSVAEILTHFDTLVGTAPFDLSTVGPEWIEERPRAASPR